MSSSFFSFSSFFLLHLQPSSYYYYYYPYRQILSYLLLDNFYLEVDTTAFTLTLKKKLFLQFIFYIT
jgi:hypothetical protein